MISPSAIHTKNQIQEMAGISISRYEQNNTPRIGIIEKFLMNVSTDRKPATKIKTRKRISCKLSSARVTNVSLTRSRKK
jgi:hypothetical protein